MGLAQILAYAALFVVGYICFIIISALRLPHLRVFVYALPPHALFLAAWSLIKVCLRVAFFVTIIAVIFLYIIYVIVKRVIPPPINWAILRAEPFRTLERTGMFRLISSIVGAIFGKGVWYERIGKAGQAFGDFLATNSDLLMASMGLTKTTPQKPPAKRRAPSKKQQARQARAAAAKAEKQERVQAAVDDVYRMCLEEAIVPVTSEMGVVERRYVGTMNAINRTMCRYGQMKTRIRAMEGGG